VAGASYSSLAKRFGIGRDALRRHKSHLLTPTLVALRHDTGTQGIVADLEALRSSALRFLESAEVEGNAQQGLMAIARTLDVLLVIAKATGELNPEPPVIDYANLPDAVALRVKLARVLEGFPEARQAVADAMDS